MPSEVIIAYGFMITAPTGLTLRRDLGVKSPYPPRVLYSNMPFISELSFVHDTSEMNENSYLTNMFIFITETRVGIYELETRIGGTGQLIGSDCVSINTCVDNDQKLHMDHFKRWVKSKYGSEVAKISNCGFYTYYRKFVGSG